MPSSLEATSRDQKLLETLKRAATRLGTSMAAVAPAWLHGRGAISVVGARRQSHVNFSVEVLAADLDSSAKEFLEKYRALALVEMRGERKPRPRAERHDLDDMLKPSRPFFEKISRDDAVYVRVFRLVRYAELERFVGEHAAHSLWYNAGKKLGLYVVEKRIVRSLDDIAVFGLTSKIGLFDVARESSNTTRVHVYECITCSGVPNIGKPLCYFEAGVIAGILERS